MKITNIAAVLVGCAVTVCADTAYAGPFTVSSTGVSDTKSVKIGTQLTDGDAKDKIDLPSVEFSTSIAPDLAVKIKTTYRTIKPSAGPNESGVADIEVSSKWNFLKASEKTYGIAMAIEPVIKIPTGDASRGLGNGDVAFKIPLIMGYKSGDWDLGSEIGYEHVFGQSKDSGYIGVLAMRRVASKLKLGGELIFQSPDAKFNKFNTQANIGFKLGIVENAELQALFGRSLHTQNGTKSNIYKLAIEYKF